MKRENLKMMNELYRNYIKKKYPSLEDFHIGKYSKRDKDTNGLTKCIIDFLKYKGWQCERIVSSGKYDPKLKKFVYATSTKGTADISATIKGLSVKIEVKYGKDTLSEKQKRYRDEIIQSGGIYYVAKDFDNFVTWYNENFDEKKNTITANNRKCKISYRTA